MKGVFDINPKYNYSLITSNIYFYSVIVPLLLYR